jgi:hypothetical protein
MFLVRFFGVLMLLAGVFGTAVVWLIGQAGRTYLSTFESWAWVSPCVLLALAGLYLILFR